MKSTASEPGLRERAEINEKDAFNQTPNTTQCSFLSECHNFHPTIPISSLYRKSRKEYWKRLEMNNENSKNLGNGYKQFADIMCQGRDTMWRVLIGYYKHQFYKFQFVGFASSYLRRSHSRTQSYRKRIRTSIFGQQPCR